MLAFTPTVPVYGAHAVRVLATTSRPLPAATRMVLSDHETKGRQPAPNHKAKVIKTPPPHSSTSPAPPSPIPNHLLNKNLKDKKRDADVTINIPFRITGNNVSLTDSLTQYIKEKLSKVTGRYESMLTKVDVHLSVEHNPSINNRAKIEVIAFVGKTILRAENRSDDMYSAIDNVQQRISRVLRKFKERHISNIKAQHHQKEPFKFAPLDEDDEYDVSDELNYASHGTDLYTDKDIAPGIPKVNEIVRRKVFPMPLQSVEEAVLCCEYVDHPWYLFRNEETNQICLVYRRNHGGYGLIEPSNPDGKDEEQVL